ncbi:MAG TPA: hypothetical protein VE913_21860 [Longimicrobium sp.]|nr:hypothetical protein [Longimicrobium sp.]
MGLLYAYFLVFPARELRPVLTTVAEWAGGDESTEVAFADGSRSRLPFGPGGVLTLAPGAGPVTFHTVLRFDPDAAILRYEADTRASIREDGGDYTPQRDERGRASIGYIFLTVTFDGERVVLDFAAATTGMSVLLDASPSIRRTLVALLREHGGIRGELDRDGDAEQFWPGAETTESITDESV